MIWVDWDGGWGRLGPGKFGYPTQSFTFMMIMVMIMMVMIMMSMTMMMFSDSLLVNHY